MGQPGSVLRLPEGFHWHRNPFLFRVFKLGVAKLFDALEPQGEVKPPRQELFVSDHPLISEMFKTPESAANWASFSVLQLLFHIPPHTQGQKEGFRDFVETVIPGLDAGLLDTDAGFYSMERARRALGIKEPDADTLELAKHAFAKSQKTVD